MMRLNNKMQFEVLWQAMESVKEITEKLLAKTNTDNPEIVTRSTGSRKKKRDTFKQ